MLALKVEKKFAQNAKSALVAAGALAKGFKAVSGTKYVFFPAAGEVKLSFPHSFVEKDFQETPRAKNPVKLSSPGLSSSYDLVGDIAVLEVPEERLKEGRTAAQILLKSNPRIKTVLRKASDRKGAFRLKEYQWLAGEKKFVALHKENGCAFKIDLPNAYFSPRLSSERSRVASLVKNGEHVLALFAGVGPFPIVIAKKKRVSVKAVELNPKAAELMRENVRLNKLEGKIEVFEGDARIYAKKFGKWSDRTLMTLPRGSEAFLDVVVKNARKGCIVHYYNVGGEREGFFNTAIAGVKKACAKSGRKCRILAKRKVLPYAPRVYSICVDFILLN